MSLRTKIIIALILVVLAVAGRFFPHLWNFTPIVAVALFAGAYLGRAYALAVPLAAMLVSDFFIGFYDFKIMLSVYGSFALIGLLGYWIKKNKNPERIIASSIFASVLFYLVTNWSVWQFSPMYEKTFAGLMLSYTLALPFFRNMLVGDLFYTLALFGAYELALYLIRKPSLKKQSIRT